MVDTMNEITMFSPEAGKLMEVLVPGEQERSMFLYVPKSGCPDSKQCQALFILRDGKDKASARETMERLEADRLAEEKHFLLLFPNPAEGGWNYEADPDRQNDIQYLIGCFQTLRKRKDGIAAFDGMRFYVADTPSASAMLMTLCATAPIHAPAVMLSDFPENYTIPEAALYVETAAWSSNPTATAYFAQANHIRSTPAEIKEGVTTWLGHNENVRLLETQMPTNSTALRIAWDRLFSETRLWRNDIYGAYQPRTDFAQRGFVPHVNDTTLGVNDGFAHTWYEYVPPQLRGCTKKVPLVIYCHGGKCIPLYAAEQSGWHDIADKEDFIVVYPKAAVGKSWNSWDSEESISDMAFLYALIEYLKTVYPIDESRVYISGFSMGGMFASAFACCYPELIAAVTPCNSYNEGYLTTFEGMKRRRAAGDAKAKLLDRSFDAGVAPSRTKLLADEKKAAKDYRMPVFQLSGLLDQPWPIENGDDLRLDTFRYWMEYNNIPAPAQHVCNYQYESGLTADETAYVGEDQRFLHHRWSSKDPGEPVLFEILLAKRMSHAIELREPQLAWQFMRKFSRNVDGSLNQLTDEGRM